MSIELVKKRQLRCNRCEVLSGLFDEGWPDGWIEYYPDRDLCPHCAYELEQWMEGEPFPRPTEDWIEDMANGILGIRLELEEVYGRSWSDRDTLTVAVNTLNTLYSAILNLKPYPESDNRQAARDIVDEAIIRLDLAAGCIKLDMKEPRREMGQVRQLLNQLRVQIEKL